MPNITPRKNKNGEITSYTIRVYHGYDSNGKRLKPYTMSYKPAQGMSAKQIEKEVQRQAMLFEEQFKLGYAPDSRQTFSQYAEYVLNSKTESGTKHSTIKRYRELLERINKGIGHIKLTDIRPQHLSELYSQLRQSGLRKGTRALPITDIREQVKAAGLPKKRLSDFQGV